MQSKSKKNRVIGKKGEMKIEYRGEKVARARERKSNMKMERSEQRKWKNMCREKERKSRGIFREGGRERKKIRIKEILKCIEER